jgi:hypothetical protein
MRGGEEFHERRANPRPTSCPWGADIRHVFTEMAAALDLGVLELSETAITVEGPDGDREIFGDRLEQLLRLLA